MSTRNALIDAFVTAIEGLSTGVAAANIGEYEGEEETFNLDADYPSIHVLYGGCELSEPLEVGTTDQTYERRWSVVVFVATKTTENSNGADAARTILEVIEEGLTTSSLTADGETVWTDLVNEEMRNVTLGRYVYAQSWRAKQLESH